MWFHQKQQPEPEQPEPYVPLRNWSLLFPKDKYFTIRGAFDGGRELMLYGYEPRRTPPRDSGSYLYASIYPSVNHRKRMFDVDCNEQEVIASLSDDEVLDLWDYLKTLLVSQDEPRSIWHQARLAEAGLAQKNAVGYTKSAEQIQIDARLELHDIETWQKPMGTYKP